MKRRKYEQTGMRAYKPPVEDDHRTKRRLRIGDKVMRVSGTIPDLDKKGHEVAKARPGVVCYLHPAGRFHGVRFDTPGGPVTEYFQGVTE